jgi:hypothetical protein
MLSLQDKLRYYYITFSISARNSHYIIKPDRKAGELIWIEDWYQECKFLFNTMYTFFFVHLSQLFYFKFIYSNNILKYDFIHIFIQYLLHHLSLYFDITTRYRKLNSGANMDIWEQIINTDFRLLLDMQKQTYSTKHVLNEVFALIFHIHVLARKPN